MPIEPPEPLRVLNSLALALADLRVLAAEHPVLMGELRRLAAERAEDELLVLVLGAVTKQ